MKKSTPKAKKPVRKRQLKGFAVMDPKLTRKIAVMGGRTISQDSAHMARIGAIGGRNSHKGTSRRLKAEA